MKKAVVILIVIIACVIAINRLCVTENPTLSPNESARQPFLPPTATTASARAQTPDLIPAPDPVITPSPTSSIPGQIPFSAPYQVRTPTPDERQWLGASQRQIDDFEDASLLRTLNPSVYDSIGELPWVADGIYRIE